MDMKYDFQNFIEERKLQAVANDLVERVRARRKAHGLTQRRLSDRSGVSYSSLRRFETTGEISLGSLLRLAQTLGCLDDFNAIFGRKAITDSKKLER